MTAAMLCLREASPRDEQPIMTATAAAAIASVIATLLRIPMGYFLSIFPLNRACEAAVRAGQYATAAAAEAAGVGMEHYYGLFLTWGLSMALSLLVVLPYFIFGKWRSKGITEQAKELR